MCEGTFWADFRNETRNNISKGCYDTQHNDIQHDNTQHNDIQNNDIILNAIRLDFT
jgi:hypothetical protein